MYQTPSSKAPRCRALVRNIFGGGLVFLAFCGFAPQAAKAARPATFWVSQTGDFFDPSNWNLGAPGLTLDAKIDNGGTAQITYQGFQTIPYVYVGSAQNTNGTLEITGDGDASFTTMIVGAVNSTGALR